MHSVPQHLTVAGYVMALPLLLELVRIWFPGKTRGRWRSSRKDTVWHTRFMAWYMAVVAGLLLLGGAVYVLVNKWHQQVTWLKTSRSSRTLMWVALCGLDFLAIRGGWTTSTMNPGRAYFSAEIVLNHAAVDPVFNFLYSVGKNERFDQQYRFMSDDEAVASLQQLNAMTVDSCATVGLDTLLRVERPDILLVLLESFSGEACHYLTPEAEEGWMPHLNQAMEEGIAFTRFYANSFRTDRGVAATLASYPGQPTNSVMKDQTKCDNLQYLSKRLGEEGYDLQFIHGGDVNFTNMQGFLRAGGITNIVRDTDFPISERLDKWGVRDDRMFAYTAERVIERSKARDTQGPAFTVFLSLSSHEPFEVPYHHYEDPYINSVAYADSCLGAMMNTLKAQPEVWNNLLIIGLPDHCYARFPADIQQHEPRRYHIPMFWTGGAVKEHRDISIIGQQTDLSATLLAQLGIDATEFSFSKNMLSPTQGHYAFYAFSDGFGLITDSCQYVQDNNRSGVGLQPGTNDPSGLAERWGKAYLQKLYDDLQAR